MSNETNQVPKQPTLTELKAYAFDTINQISNLQQQLDYLNNEINKAKQVAQKEQFQKQLAAAKPPVTPEATKDVASQT